MPDKISSYFLRQIRFHVPGSPENVIYDVQVPPKELWVYTNVLASNTTGGTSDFTMGIRRLGIDHNFEYLENTPALFGQGFRTLPLTLQENDRFFISTGGTVINNILVFNLKGYVILLDDS